MPKYKGHVELFLVNILVSINKILRNTENLTPNSYYYAFQLR